MKSTVFSTAMAMTNQWAKIVESSTHQAKRKKRTERKTP
jgi:hypothetical protein